ncbi:LIM/homeobox protein lim-6-like [Leptopilina boulardi]|uniref:LIM/homeobox protein lim-6-like n=1 Tax=Leptopilina boulardi TaxID=63433 RepID=UPI0021F549AF|nr:LIM/homeobox protein lim-6-like [Leptopilina boulardi]
MLEHLRGQTTWNQGDSNQNIPPGPPLQFRQVANNNVEGTTVSVKTEVGTGEPTCAGCGLVIVDRFLMSVRDEMSIDRSYHEDCLSCFHCGTILTKSCFIRNLKLYCRSDYEQLFGVKCARCSIIIGGKDLVMRVADLVFHLNCFGCYMCGQPLPTGAHFILRQNQPVCRRDFEHEMYINSPQDDEGLDEVRPRDGRRGPKRPRTILTSMQRRQFKASFEVSPKPCRKVREALAKDTGLSVRVVQVWFQNQRAKMKKLQRKAKTESGSDKEPKEERKTESPHSDHSHYMSALNMRDGESSNFSSATQPLNPNNPYSPDDNYPVHSGESFCSTDLSLDGTEAGFEIAENETGGPESSHQGSSHSLHTGTTQESPSLSQSLHAAINNPIDKLYMMSNNYFSPNHT